MRFLQLLAVIFLSFFLFGSPHHENSDHDENMASPVAVQARKLYQQGNYQEAADLYQRVYKEALSRNDIPTAIAAANNTAGCFMTLRDYKSAISIYLEAKAFTQRIGNHKLRLVLDANLALLYGLLGDYQKTISLGEQVLQKTERQATLIDPYLTLYLADSYHRTGQFSKAYPYYLRSVESSDNSQNDRQMSLALDHLGLAFLDQDQPERAQPYIYEAFRLRRLHQSEDLFLSHRSLGKLYRIQNRYPEAEIHLSRAIHHYLNKPGRTQIHELYAERARVRETTGNHKESLQDYRTALNLYDQGRSQLPVAGQSAATSEAAHATLRSSFIRFVANQLETQKNLPLMMEALSTLEEARSESLPFHTASSTSSLQKKYLDQLRHSEALLFSVPQESSRFSNLRESVRQIKIELAQLELIANLDHPDRPQPEPLRQLRQSMRSLDEDEVVFSFYLDQPHSYVWEITQSGIHMYRIPSKEVIQDEISKFKQDIHTDRPSSLSNSERLYGLLFGGASKTASQKTVWTIIPDDCLFDLPFAALKIDSSGSKNFLIQKYVIRLKPALFHSAENPPDTSRPVFIGFGDAIYNRADNRLDQQSIHSFKEEKLQLPRLFSSAEEVISCAKVWGDQSVILTGEKASEKLLHQIGQKTPAILHIAAHFIPSMEDPSQTLIALGYDPTIRNQDLYGSAQISSLKNNLKLVVLSGCHSGHGEKLPGAGLMGLTRSWLLAGASSVTATYWPIPDHNGNFFTSFYRHYLGAIQNGVIYPAAKALQLAQIETLSSSDWSSAISYWASFFLISKE